jgi:threonine aldolase
MNFASDNTAGVAPAIVEAMARVADGYALGYGEDAATARVERHLAQVFEHEVAAFLVPTGTAANALALAQVSPPWGAVLCHAESHIVTDECGATEFFGGGLKLIGLAGEGNKIAPETLEAALARGPWGGPHHVTASALSLSQATEAGTIYRAAEVQRLAEIAHRHGVAVHMDGARFANALVRTNVTPAELTWRAGVDVLSLGATKGGAFAAEAVIFFDPSRAGGMQERRKRGGHLLSKHRYLAAQIEAYLTDDLWLDLARHANRMADLLVERLAPTGIKPVWPVEANEVFVPLSADADRRLKAAGASYYPWASASLPAGLAIAPGATVFRLVTSFSTTEAEVDRFAALARGA